MDTDFYWSAGLGLLSVNLDLAPLNSRFGEPAGFIKPSRPQPFIDTDLIAVIDCPTPVSVRIGGWRDSRDPVPGAVGCLGFL